MVWRNFLKAFLATLALSMILTWTPLGELMARSLVPFGPDVVFWWWPVTGVVFYWAVFLVLQFRSHRARKKPGEPA